MSDKTDTQYLRDICDLLNSMHSMLSERLTAIEQKVNRFSEFVLEVSPSDAKQAIAELEDELQE
ncbi:MAG: hypothetical protein CMB45_04980 [Euryarchaeota archaeon]|nr:hypothetical protein [Euryarchaeota archaeon]|tara:strand:+ start:19604 stop:19795 length:192 start_codon:yes stop_codon:yes gene_type:complete